MLAGEKHWPFFEQTEGGIIKAVVYVCVSRTPAALA